MKFSYSLISAFRLRSFGMSKVVERVTPTSRSFALSPALTGLSSMEIEGAQGASGFIGLEVVADSDLGLFDRVDWDGSASAGLFSAAKVVFSLSANFEIGKVSSVSI